MKICLEVIHYRTHRAYRALSTAFLNAPGGQHALVLRLLKGYAYASRLAPGIKATFGTRRVASDQVFIEADVDGSEHIVEVRGSRWKVTCSVARVSGQADVVDVRASFELLRGKAENVGVALGVVQDDWSRDCYVCAPGGAYDGNRFDTWNDSFPPFLPRSRWLARIPTTTTEIPGLRRDTGDNGGAQILSPAGDLCTPAIGVLDRRNGRAQWLVSPQQASGLDVGLFARENARGDQATLGVQVPAVREKSSFHLSSMYPSLDRGASLRSGDSLQLHLRLHTSGSGETPESFFETHSRIRTEFSGDADFRHHLPLSEAWRIHENRYNDRYWDEQNNYYRVGQPYTLPESVWTAGWVGGLQGSLALLARGNALSVERVLRNLEFFFSPAGQSPAGIFYTVSDGVNWGGDDYYLHRPIGTRSWAMVRRIGDCLYYALKHLVLMERIGLEFRIRDHWRLGLRRCADALCAIWKKEQQFGQYIDPQTLGIHIGGSWGGAIVPAGLMLASQYFGEARYARVAGDSLRHLYDEFQRCGYTTGGPGDILQAPDSESATSLLESLVVAYEITGDAQWLDHARHAGNYCLTWFLGYDFRFPAESTFARMDMKTRGACFASVQNKCAVPNICTLSGDVFWRLYRYTGNTVFMETITACLHNAQQYISTNERPIASPKLADAFLEHGNMNECIQTGDWSGPPGEIPYHLPISWSEAANMLGICDIPGIYVVTDRRQVFVADHLEVEVAADEAGGLVLHITNPTAFDAETTLFAETREEAGRVHTPYAPPVFETVPIPAGGRIVHGLSCRPPL